MSYDEQSTDRHAGSKSDPDTSGSQHGQQFDMFAQVEAPEASQRVTHGAEQVPVVPPTPATLAERFEQFNELNPALYDTLAALARRFIAATGRRKLSIQRLVEIARWDLMIATQGQDEFQINNDFCAFYARLIMWSEEDLDDVFNCRSSAEADRWIALVKNGLVAL